MQIHSVTPNACGLKAGLRTTLFILSGRRHMSGSLEKQFPTACAPAHDRRNQQIPELILGKRRFPEAEWLNRRVKCQRFSTPNKNARGAVLEIVEEFLKVSPITAT